MQKSSPVLRFTLCALLALAGSLPLLAQETKVDPTGTWGWTMQGRNGAERKLTLKLKLEGETLKGTVITPGRDGQPSETAIQDAKLKGDDLSFTVVREFNGNKSTSKYNGKVSADAIKGKIEFDRNGETTSRDWNAKRVTEKETEKK